MRTNVLWSQGRPEDPPDSSCSGPPSRPPEPEPEPGAPKDIFARTGGPPQNNLTCELLIDDKPLDGLLQKVGFWVDAETLVPHISIELVPTDFEVDIEAAGVDVVPTIVHCLLKPQEMRPVVPIRDPAKAQELIDAWQRHFAKKPQELG